MRIEGTVSPGYESVRQLFEANFRSGGEKNAQLCVYVGDERVVDLWGCIDEDVDRDFGPDSLVNVFSSTKCITSFVVAKLVDEGLLSYDGRIVDYWPEFGAHGKDSLTLADMLRHEAGLASFDTSIDVDDLRAERIKTNVIGNIIEKQKPHYRDASEMLRREYHGMTRGWILNEVVRRADKKGRTIGEILREDISGPLGVDAFVGLTPTEIKRVSPLSQDSIRSVIQQSFRPKALGRKIDPNVFGVMQMAHRWKQVLRCSSRRQLRHPPGLTGFQKDLAERFNDDACRSAEIPSANGHASARGLAHLAGFMANGGAFKDFRFLSEATVTSFHADAVERYMSYCHNFFVRGGVSLERLPTRPSREDKRALNGLEGYYGWGGVGGSQIQWIPEEKIAFAFVPTFLCWIDISNEKGRRLQREVLRCVKKLNQEENSAND